MNTNNEAQIDFCVRYLLSNGVDAGSFQSIANSLSSKKVKRFELQPITEDHVFFAQIAKGLRDLWPAGTKDGKWPWRCPVSEAVERLKFLWKEQDLADKYSVDDCLAAARRYLAQFENHDIKYMVLLKYFIFKQKTMGVAANGIYKTGIESPLVKYLEANQNEIDFETNMEGEFL